MKTETKICSTCKIEKDLETGFTFRTDAKRWRGQCKECVANTIRNRRKRPEVLKRERELRAEYKRRNPEEYK